MKSYWGPYFWHIIHTIAKNFPLQPNPMDKFKARQLINLIAYIIPCIKCRQHYITNITKFKPNFDNPANFFKWTVKIHNLVNKSNKKPIINFNLAYKMNSNFLNNQKIKKLFAYLLTESNNLNISKQALTRFIDIITYFTRYKTEWNPNKDVKTIIKKN